MLTLPGGLRLGRTLLVCSVVLCAVVGCAKQVPPAGGPQSGPPVGAPGGAMPTAVATPTVPTNPVAPAAPGAGCSTGLPANAPAQQLAGAGTSPHIQQKFLAWGAQQQATAAVSSSSKNDLKQIGLAFHNFHDQHNGFPAPNGMGEENPQCHGLSWRVMLLPDLDQFELYKEFKLDEPWDSEHNKKLIPRMPKVFGGSPDGKTRVHVFTGPEAPFHDNKLTRLRDITDGSSNTILCVVGGPETADIWTKPGGLPFDPKQPLKSLGKVDRSLPAVMMDGSTRSIATTPETFAKVVQNADGEVIGDNAFADSGSTGPSSTPSFKINSPVTPLTPVASKIELSFIPAETFFAAVVHPRRFLSHPVVKALLDQVPPQVLDPWGGGLPYQVSSTLRDIIALRTEMGIAVEHLDEVVLLLDARAPAFLAKSTNSVPPFGMIVRNSAPLDFDGIFNRLTTGSESVSVVEHEGFAIVLGPELDAGQMQTKKAFPPPAYDTKPATKKAYPGAGRDDEFVPKSPAPRSPIKPAPAVKPVPNSATKPAFKPGSKQDNANRNDCTSDANVEADPPEAAVNEPVESDAPIVVEDSCQVGAGVVPPGVGPPNAPGGPAAASAPERLAFAFASDSIMLVGSESFVRRMISARQATTATTKLTKQLEALGNPLAALTVDGVAIEQSLKQTVQSGGFEIAILVGFIKDIQEVNASFDLSAKDLLNANMRFNTPQNATSLFSMLFAQFDSFKTAYSQSRPGIIEQARVFSDQLVNETKFTNTAETISLIVPQIRNLEQLPAALKPAFDRAKEVGAQVQRKNNMKQVGLAFHNYESVNRHLPALNGPGTPGAPHPGLSWRVYLLPYLDHGALFQKFKLDEPWDSPNNKSLIKEMPQVFGSNPEGKTSIHVFTGPGTPFRKDVGAKFSDVKDGFSNSFLAVEAGPDTAEIWTKPTALTLDPAKPLKCLGATKEFHALFFDGSVRMITNMNAVNFGRAVQIADGKPVDFGR